MTDADDFEADLPFHGSDTLVISFTGGDPQTISPTATLRDAATLMETHGFSLLAVGELSAIEGVVSERDIVRAVAANADLDTTLVVDVESTDLKWALPESTVGEVVQEMMSGYIRHVLIGDAGSLVGVVSMRDLMSAYID